MRLQSCDVTSQRFVANCRVFQCAFQKPLSEQCISYYINKHRSLPKIDALWDVLAGVEVCLMPCGRFGQYSSLLLGVRARPIPVNWGQRSERLFHQTASFLT